MHCVTHDLSTRQMNQSCVDSFNRAGLKNWSSLEVIFISDPDAISTEYYVINIRRVYTTVTVFLSNLRPLSSKRT